VHIYRLWALLQAALRHQYPGPRAPVPANCAQLAQASRPSCLPDMATSRICLVLCALLSGFGEIFSFFGAFFLKMFVFSPSCRETTEKGDNTFKKKTNGRKKVFGPQLLCNLFLTWIKKTKL
jgi:hypothetical protein